MIAPDKLSSQEHNDTPSGFVNISGAHVRDLARGVMGLLEQPFAEGMQADLAAGILICIAVDLLRANYGDDRIPDGVRSTVIQRLSRPLDFWGAARQEGVSS